MSNERRQLMSRAVRVGGLLGASAALLFAGASFAQNAPSNEAPPAAGAAAAESADASELSEVVVTGTRIRGVAPVGSTLITIDEAAMQETGLTNVNDILDTQPAITDLGGGTHLAGGTTPNGATSSVNSANIHGLGVQATLSLINGHRGWEEQTVSDVFNPDNFPPQMLARIDVVPDGTSAIYGADAVAGTVNYNLRAPANVVETYFDESGMPGQNTWYATGILGRVWSLGGQSGGIIYGYQYRSTGPLQASSYPTLYNNNFSPYGGSASTTFAAPGNITVGANNYAVPFGQNGQSLTLAQLGAAGSANRQNIFAGAPPYQGTDISPQNEGTNNVANYFQNINDWLQFFGDSMYDHHETNSYTSGSVNDIAAKVPNTNPYSPCNPSHYTNGVVTGPAALVAACTANAGLTVNYNDLNNVGAQYNWGIDKGWMTSNGFHIKLPGDWQLTPQATLNQHLTYSANTTLGTPNVNTFNYFCDPTAYSCAQPGQISVSVPPYQGVATAGPILTTGRFYQLGADGALFSLPGGKVRIATGIEDDYWEADKHTSTQTEPSRRDKAGYVELYVPIVGGGNALPGIQALEIDVAGRYDDYTDTGVTKNPKFGINWTVTPGLKVHGSAGTSFHPAAIQDLGSLAPRWTTSSIADTAVLPGLCPQCTNSALFGTAGANKLVYSEAMGVPYPVLLPETARSFSAGFDWAPPDVPGLTAGVNWWYIKYVNQVGNNETSGGAASALNSQVWNAHIIYNPTFFPQLAANNPLSYFEPTPLANTNDPNCAAVVGKRVTTQALYNEFLACSNDNAGGQTITGTTSTNPNDVIAYTYFGQLNAGTTLGDGFDLNAGYAWRNEWGNWKTNFTGEYVPRFDVSVVSGAPVINEAGHFGYIERFRGRLQFSWQRNFSFGSLSDNLFVNYQGHQRQDFQYLPVGAPLSYENINAHTTLDVAIVYNTGSSPDFWLAKNVSLTLSSQNVLNERPPRVLNNTILFDAQTGWPPARALQFLIGKSW